jgi:hypothetical protein
MATSAHWPCCAKGPDDRGVDAHAVREQRKSGHAGQPAKQHYASGDKGEGREPFRSDDKDAWELHNIDGASVLPRRLQFCRLKR